MVPVVSFTYQVGGGVQTSDTRAPEQPIITSSPMVMPTIYSNEEKRMESFQRLYPPHFDNDASEDAQDFLDICYLILYNLGLVESN